MEQRIRKALSELGINVATASGMYCYDAFKMISENEEYMQKIGKIEEEIARKRNKGVTGVKSGMRNAMIRAYKEADDQTREKYFKNTKKKSLSNLISLVWLQIKEDES